MFTKTPPTFYTLYAMRLLNSGKRDTGLRPAVPLIYSMTGSSFKCGKTEEKAEAETAREIMLCVFPNTPETLDGYGADITNSLKMMCQV